MSNEQGPLRVSIRFERSYFEDGGLWPVGVVLGSYGDEHETMRNVPGIWITPDTLAVKLFDHLYDYTSKFTDSDGIDYQGLAEKVVRELVKEMEQS